MRDMVFKSAKVLAGSLHISVHPKNPYCAKNTIDIGTKSRWHK